MIKKIVLCNFIIICLIFVNGCGIKSSSSNDFSAISVSPTETLAPTTELTETVTKEVSKVQTETKKSGIYELKTLHIADIFDEGKIFADISENDMDFFKNKIEKLTVPDARKGERAKDILEGDDWSKGLILLNSIPEKNIYLYGYNDEKHYGFGLIMDIGEEQHIYTFPYNYMTSTATAPSICTSEDGSKIFVTCLTGTGTGVSVSELYVFQINGRVNPFYVNINDLVELFNNKITMSYDSENELMTVYSEGKQITTDYLIDNGVNPTQFYCGNFISYIINNETVKVICKPAISIQEMSIASYLKNDSLEAEIKFEYDSIGNIIGFNLGEITAVSTTDDGAIQ